MCIVRVTMKSTKIIMYIICRMHTTAEPHNRTGYRELLLVNPQQRADEKTAEQLIA